MHCQECREAECRGASTYLLQIHKTSRGWTDSSANWPRAAHDHVLVPFKMLEQLKHDD